MDKETQAVEDKGSKMLRFLESEEWGWIKEIFSIKAMDLQSIRNLEASNGVALVSEIKSRKVAVDILLEVIKEVEGIANQHDLNRERKPEEREAITIVR